MPLPGRSKSHAPKAHPLTGADDLPHRNTRRGQKFHPKGTPPAGADDLPHRRTTAGTEVPPQRNTPSRSGRSASSAHHGRDRSSTLNAHPGRSRRPTLKAHPGRSRRPVIATRSSAGRPQSPHKILFHSRAVIVILQPCVFSSGSSVQNKNRPYYNREAQKRKFLQKTRKGFQPFWHQAKRHFPKKF